MSRNNQVARILMILDALDQATDGVTVNDLFEKVCARSFDCTKRTIYRDLEALERAGFPLYPDTKDQNTQKWRLDRTTSINKHLVLSTREIFALFLAKGALAPLKETPFYQDLESVFARLEERLGKKHSEFLKSLDLELKFEPGPQWGLGLDPDILETIRAGCAEGHEIECEYFSVNSQKQSLRRLGPHYLYYSKGGLYLVAEDLDESNIKNKVKKFAIPRIKSATMLETSYEGNIRTPDDLFGNSLGVYTSDDTTEVILEFDNTVAPFVRERRWHPSQRVINLENGKIRMTLDVSQTPELYAWILGFGEKVTVVKPIEAVAEITTRAQSILKNYEIYQVQ